MVNGIFAAAEALAKGAFEAALPQMGKAATWKRRTSAVPDSGGAASRAYGHNDMLDPGAVLDVDDSTIFANGGTVLVWMNASTRDQAVTAGQIVTGSTMGWVSLDHEVADGDMLVLSDGTGTWRVDGVQIPNAAIYRELTLTRVRR
jgi:hypothetical protein